MKESKNNLILFYVLYEISICFFIYFLPLLVGNNKTNKKRLHKIDFFFYIVYNNKSIKLQIH